MNFLRGLLILGAFASVALASIHPKEERSLEACKEALVNGRNARIVPFAPSSFIPLKTLLGSAKCPYIPKMWRVGDISNKESPSSGLLYMFHVADEASDEIISTLDIDAVTPEYDHRNPKAGADATLELILSDHPPRYIRNAVITRDLVLMTVPLLKRVKIKGRTGKRAYTYYPVLVRGHQEIDKDDEMAAATAAWILEQWLGRTPSKALLYAVPIAEKRTASDRKQPQNKPFVISTREYLPQVQALLHSFRDVAVNPERRDTVQPRRCTTCSVCPWAASCREKMEEAGDLSMVPLPPSAEEAAVLTAVGYGNLESLAKLRVNSEEFFRVALIAGIQPDRLRRYVGRAVARELGEAIVMEAYEDPFAEADIIVHHDVEDIYMREIKSGTYLFGIALEDAHRPLDRPRMLEDKYIFAEELNQDAIDDAWAQFIRYLKKNPRLRKNSYLITTYSKHEHTKVEQEFDILKQPANKFSKEEKNSSFYSQYGDDKAPLGRLIRRKEFFKEYPDISPADVFSLLDHKIDLLEFYRGNIATPPFSNSLKKIDPYIGRQLKTRRHHPQGHNGLNSMAWAKRAFETGEPAQLEEVRAYNELDVEGNAHATHTIRKLAGKSPHPRIHRGEYYNDYQEKVRAAVGLKNFVETLQEKRTLLTQVLGKPLSSLTDNQLDRLKSLLDRSEYLERRRRMAEDEGLTEEQIRENQHRLKFEANNERRTELYEFLRGINRNLSNPSQELTLALAELSTKSRPSNWLTPLHINEILLLETLEAKMNRITWINRRGLDAQLELPKILSQKLEAILERFSDDPEMSGFPEATMPRDIERTWQGLYYNRVFVAPGRQNTGR